MKMHKVKGIIWSPRCIYPVSFGFTQRKKSVRELTKAGGVKGDPDMSGCDGMATYFTSDKGEHICLIWVRRGLDVKYGATVAAHECVHAMQFARNVISEDIMSAEAEAYFMQWLMSFALAAMEE